MKENVRNTIEDSLNMGNSVVVIGRKSDKKLCELMKEAKEKNAILQINCTNQVEELR